jgi:4-alpha-glucanotransferase
MAHEIDVEILAAEYGLEAGYYDYRGEYRQFSDDARLSILRAMGVSGAQKEQASFAISSLLPSVIVCTQEESIYEIRLNQISQGDVINVLVKTEEGKTFESTYEVQKLEQPSENILRLPLPVLPMGYHQLTMTVSGHSASCALIITPTRCYELEAISEGIKLWGLSLQLYTLRSQNNWGIGDFGDLQNLIPLASAQGCQLIGLNPLHALRPADPAHISPYSPSHRDYLNVLYISVPDIPEFPHSQQAQQLVAQSQALLNKLRNLEGVDYVRVAEFKLQVLRILFEEFEHQHLKSGTERAKEFNEYIHQQGAALYQHALYDALDAYFSAQPLHRYGWRSWPCAFHSPQSVAVRQFAKHHATEIRFYMYLQWLAAEQLATTQRLARTQGMSIGLYGDVAVGVDPNGSEVWSNQQLYIEGASVGAPPDPLALKGQDWGIPPQHPFELQRQAYQPFVHMLRATMRSVGALRIDHVMTLCRLWWVPHGMEATNGVYVRYPLDDLVKLVALESLRNQCVVIGEDLGTVPDAMRHAMERFALYHYKVLFFEKNFDGQFKVPHEYPQRALAVVTTHDLPPFKSWWQGDDIALRSQLNMYPDDATQQYVLYEREADRRLLILALARTGLWYWHEHQPLPEYSFALMCAAYLYVGLSPSALLVIQPEDLLEMVDPVNVPGTSTQHANWQRKLSAGLSECLHKPEVQEMLSAMSKARRGEDPNI